MQYEQPGMSYYPSEGRIEEFLTLEDMTSPLPAHKNALVVKVDEEIFWALESDPKA